MSTEEALQQVCLQKNSIVEGKNKFPHAAYFVPMTKKNSKGQSVVINGQLFFYSLKSNIEWYLQTAIYATLRGFVKPEGNLGLTSVARFPP